MKRPAFQFYPADWRKDLELQSCGIAARGLWHEMMCLMHEAEPYGYLFLNGKPMTDVQAATACRVTPREYRALLAELTESGVPGTGPNGEIFSRRMVRDEQVREARAAGGEAGAEHGHKGGSHGVKGGRPRKSKGPEKPPLKPAPSSSSSPSASSSNLESLRDLSGKPPDVEPAGKNGHDYQKKKVLRAQAVGILNFLNEKAERNFEAVAANVDPIVARLREGSTPDDIRAVIANRVRKWKGDPEMNEFLRPKTLFSRTNFANYKGELAPADPQPSEGQP